MTVHELFICVCALVGVRSFNLDLGHPVIYKKINGNGSRNGDYFGMSVAVRPHAADSADSWFVQVGAPRGGISPQITGSVYRCHLQGVCRPLAIDRGFGRYEGEGVRRFIGKEDEAWLGSSMDIKKFGEIERSIVCGHRWMNEYLKNSENIDLTYLMTGICYLQNLYDGSDESEMLVLLPLVDSDKIYAPKPYIPNLSTYHWGLGQAGASVLLTKNGEILIGAPGVTHWIGSVIRYDPHLSDVVANFALNEFPKNKRYTYLGYSVAAGQFFKDRKMWFAVGAPRGANYRGEVFVFQYRGSTDLVHVETALKGSSLGEYFGSALIAEDVNGDGYDDLVVGAPTFSKRYPDEGRIYVYLGTNKGNFLLESQVIDGRGSRGRFGTCVASLSDINRDGFNDVAVAAPYEDGQRGVLYIYRGFPSGILSRPAQRILARDLNPHLRGFGISVSAGVDVDGNKFGDVVVGSHLSEDVVLLRSRPIISLRPEIKTGNTSLLDRRAKSYFNVSFCSSYTGSDPPLNADILQSIEIDSLHGRATTRGFRSSYPILNASVRLKLGETYCEEHSVLLNVTDQNYAPLLITLKNELPECSNKTTDSKDAIFFESNQRSSLEKFSKWCPIGDKAEVSKEILFAGICGADSICLSDLRISCVVPEFLNGTYVLGSTDNFRLIIRLINHAEPALDAKLKISTNVGLLWNEDDSESTAKLPRKVFLPKINGFIPDNFQENFLFKMPFEEVLNLTAKTGIPNEEEFVLKAEVGSDNPDLDLADNRCKVTVRLVSDAAVVFRSSSSATKFYGSKKSNETESRLDVIHYYEVEKKGWSPILDAELLIRVPASVDNQPVVTVMESSDWITVLHPKTEENRIKDVQHENNSRSVNCSVMNDRCDEYKIVFPQGIPRGPSSWIKVILSLNASEIELKDEIVVLETFAVLTYSTPFASATKQAVESQSLTLFPPGKGKPLEGYVIALSVLGGGFILFLIVSWLKRNNFFKRTKKEELEALKNQETWLVYFSAAMKAEEHTS